MYDFILKVKGGLGVEKIRCLNDDDGSNGIFNLIYDVVNDGDYEIKNFE